MTAVLSRLRGRGRRRGRTSAASRVNRRHRADSRRRWLALVVLCLAPAGTALAQDRFCNPDFVETDNDQPARAEHINHPTQPSYLRVVQSTTDDTIDFEFDANTRGRPGAREDQSCLGSPSDPHRGRYTRFFPGGNESVRETSDEKWNEGGYSYLYTYLERSVDPGVRCYDSNTKRESARPNREWRCIVGPPAGYVGADEAGGDTFDFDRLRPTLQAPPEMDDDNRRCSENLGGSFTGNSKPDVIFDVSGFELGKVYDVYLLGMAQNIPDYATDNVDVDMAPTHAPFDSAVCVRASPRAPPLKSLDVTGRDGGGLVVLGATDQVELTWAAASTQPPAAGFQYRFRRADEIDFQPWVPVSGGGGITSLEISDLELGINYTFQVRSANEDGGTGLERTIRARPARLPTLQSLSVSPTGDGDGKVALEWTLDSTGGLPVERFQYRYEESTKFDCEDRSIQSDVTWVDSEATMLGTAIDQLTNGRHYRFEARAVTGGGEGPTLSACFDVGRPPFAPQLAVTFPGSEEGGEVVIAWYPARNGGFRITQYEYLVILEEDFQEQYPGFPGDPEDIPADTDTRWRNGGNDEGDLRIPLTGDKRLTPGGRYVLLLRGVNVKGKGDLSYATFTVRPGVPEAPDLSADAVDGGARLVWRAAGDRGAPLLAWQFRVREEDDGEEDWSAWRAAPFDEVEVEGDFHVYVLLGLSNNVVYKVQLRGVNVAGFGDESVQVEVIPASDAALRPVVRNLKLRDEEGNEVCTTKTTTTGTVTTCVVEVTWEKPSLGGGDELLRYEWSLGDGTWRALDPPPDLADAMVTLRIDEDLEAGIRYVIQVRAVTILGGTGPIRTVDVVPGQVPDHPDDVSVIPDDAAVTLNWQPADGKGTTIIRYEYRYRAAGAAWSAWINAGLSDQVEIRGLTNGVEHEFQVRAVNVQGPGRHDHNEAKGTPTAQPPPPAPGNIGVSVGNALVSLRWRPASDVAGYVCRYRVVDEVAWSDCGGGVCSVEDDLLTLPSVEVGDLTNGVAYQFEVRSCKGGASSDPSTAEATPVAATLLPGAPEELVAEGGDGTVTLRWGEAARNDGRAVTGYEYRWRRVFGEFEDWIDVGEALEVTVASLVNGTRLQFEVRARKGEIVGPAAAAWITLAGVPDAPLEVRHATGDGEMTVTWRPPADGGSPILHYEYRLRPVGGEFGDWAPANDRLVEMGERFAILLTGLRDGVGYEVEIRGVNGIGPGPVGRVTSVPGTVAVGGGLSAVPGDGQVELRWPVSASGGVVRYEVRCLPEAGECTGWLDTQDLVRRDGQEFVLTLRGFANGTRYVFEVRAVGVDGPEPAQTAAATPSGRPGEPALELAPGDGEAVLTWRPPAFDGGAPVRRYEYRFGTDGASFGRWQSVAAEPPLLTVGGLTNGVEYVFELRAVTEAGPGAAALAAVTPAAGPSAPRDAVALRRDGAVTLRWRRPASDGGVAISGYEIRYRRASEDAFSGWMPVGPVTETSVTGLVNGIDYEFEVRAANAVAMGVAASASATPGAAPGAPRGLRTEAGDGRVALAWEAPEDDGGLEIVRYEVRSTPAGQAEGAWADVGLERTMTVEGLTNGVAYIVEVRAVNAEGGGTVVSAVATPSVASVPAAPTLTARAEDARVVLSWNVPDNGGEDILRFEYRWRVAAEAYGEWVDAGLATTAVVAELVNGNFYEFETRAVNEIGAGEAGTASGTPAGLPGQPALAARAGAEEVILSWQPPEDTGGLAITGYEYRWREELGTFVDWREAGLERAATARGLRNGITYVFEVRAINSKGAGAAATAEATPASGVDDALLANAWLARFGRVSAGHVVDALQGRFADAPDFAGFRPVPGRRSGGRAPEQTAPTREGAPESERVRHRGGVGGRGSAWTGDAPAEVGAWDSAVDPWGSASAPWDAAVRGPWEEPANPLPRSRGGGLDELGRMLLQRILPGDSFLLTAQPTESSTRVSAWGRATSAGFAGGDEFASVDGRVRTITVGGDVERGALLAGVAVSHSTGEGDFTFLGDGTPRRGDDAESTLTGFYPYVRLRGERVSFWGTAGTAQGDLGLTGSGVDVAADVTAGMGALGVRGRWIDAGAFQVALKSDMLRTWLTAEGERLVAQESAANRLRLLVEASATTGLAGGRMTSSIEVGLRHDSGGVDDGGGVEVGGGLRYAGARRLTVAVEGRATVGHGADGFGEWGLSGSLLYAPRPSGAGASLRLVPAWGTTASSAERLWADPESWRLGSARPAFGVDAEFAYGFRARRGPAVYGPYLAAGYRRGAWTPRTGWRLGGGRATVDVAAFHRDGPQGGNGLQLRLRFSL